MMEHMVSIKFNRELDAETRQSIVDELAAFKGEIPGIVELSAGINETEELENKHGFSLGLRILFEDLESLRSYGPHPVHQAFLSRIGGMLEQVVVVDFPVS
ncbi:Dabb family protein [Paenibacillus sp. D51F]